MTAGAGVPDTRTPLITIHDVDAACIAATPKLAEGLPVAAFRAALEDVAPRLRARWVADALEEIAADMTTELLTAYDLRARAAEYRGGTR